MKTKLLFLLVFFMLSGVQHCGGMDPFKSSTADVSQLIEIPVEFRSADTGNSLDLTTALTSVTMRISGCGSGYSNSGFSFNGSTVNFYLNDTGCLLSVCSFTFNGEAYTTTCTSFNTSVGSLTTFTGTGGANPGGDTVYAYVATQLSSPITPSSTAVFYIVENDNFGSINLPITTPVLSVTNNTPSSAPYTVPAASTSSVLFGFKMLYPNPPPSTATTLNYTVIGSSLAGTDYTAPSGSITIPANASTATLTVTLLTTNTQARESPQALGISLTPSSSYVGYGTPAVMITNTSTNIAGPAADPGMIFHGAPTSFTNSGGFVSAWTDTSGSGLGASFTQSASNSLVYNASGLNSLATVGFNGSNFLKLNANNTHINNAAFTEKVVTLVFKTAADITTKQILYQQGDNTSGLNLYILNSQICGASWASSGATPVNVCAYIGASSAYSMSFVFDKNNAVENLYLSGVLVDQATIPATALTASTANVGIGGNAGTTKDTTSTSYTSVNGFLGTIAEIFHYSSTGASAVLTDTQIRGLHGYLDAKYALTFPAVTITPVSSNISKFGGATNAFLVSRSIATSSPLTVYYTTGGTAVAGTNYVALPGTVTIPAYNASTYLSVTTLNDGVPGSVKTLSITLANDLANDSTVTTYLGAPNSASTNILDYAPPASATLISWLIPSSSFVTTYGGTVTAWTDETANNISATGSGNHAPTSTASTQPYITFTNPNTPHANYMTFASNSLLDNASFTKKTFAVVFQSTDVTTTQVIYKQGDTNNGMNIVMSGGKVYFTGYGSSGWATNPNNISTTISTNTLYAVIFEYDQPSVQLRGKINRTSITASSSGVGTLAAASGASGAIGALGQLGIKLFNGTTSTTTTNYANTGTQIYEILLFNGILNTTDYNSLYNYLLTKYNL